jgi:phosphoribosyl 1,2-cyclic phosphodiesterase
LKFASLGSGSDGNALLISTGDDARPTTVMLDCGFPVREVEKRLARLTLRAEEISGIVVTHEHQDHAGGALKLARRFGIPVWLSYGTWSAIAHDCRDVTINFCRDGEAFRIGDLDLLPYTVPHDAREPLQFVVAYDGKRLGILTDAGQSTPHLVGSLGACDALVIECNHDAEMLAGSSYPESLKRRIGGAYGHLSNVVSAEILGALDQSRLGKVVGAHLSRQNNRPELAHAALTGALHSSKAEIIIACQEQGFGWESVGAAM